MRFVEHWRRKAQWPNQDIRRPKARPLPQLDQTPAVRFSVKYTTMVVHIRMIFI